mmetsp:Transcript_30385/g.76724  ORF Transcript_30385/g.76724 Transcript_30385/m.76724 type:complete len:240 (+) Transcript_30385:522-1241(+)
MRDVLVVPQGHQEAYALARRPKERVREHKLMRFDVIRLQEDLAVSTFVGVQNQERRDEVQAGLTVKLWPSWHLILAPHDTALIHPSAEVAIALLSDDGAQHHAQGVEVACKVCEGPLLLCLRRCVDMNHLDPGAHQGRVAIFLDHSRGAEINDPDVLVRVHHDVVGFHVAVDKVTVPAMVQVLQDDQQTANHEASKLQVVQGAQASTAPFLHDINEVPLHQLEHHNLVVGDVLFQTAFV